MQTLLEACAGERQVHRTCGPVKTAKRSLLSYHLAVVFRHFPWGVIMDPSERILGQLAVRITKLEAQSRRWKLATALLVLIGVVFVLLGAKPAQRMESTLVRARQVEAEQFILKGQDGHTYARLILDPDLQRENDHAFGTPSPAALEFYDVYGRVAVILPTPPKVTPVR